MPTDSIKASFEKMGKKGAQLDADGNLVGDALTQLPRQHSFQVNGNQLYAWCSLDTLFLPGLLGTTAQVESTDPITGDRVKLTVTPEGIRDLEPDELYLSIADASDPNCCVPGQSGPESKSCSQMHFFSTPESAEAYAQQHPGTAVFSAKEAFELAQVVWLEPYKAASQELSTPNA